MIMASVLSGYYRVPFVGRHLSYHGFQIEADVQVPNSGNSRLFIA